MMLSLCFLSLQGLGCGWWGGSDGEGLASADPETRLDALLSLTADEVRARSAAVSALASADADTRVRQLAIGRLGTASVQSATPFLGEQLRDFSSVGLQLAAATALGNMASAAACDELLSIYFSWPTSPRDLVAVEVRDALIRTHVHCEPVVHGRIKESPDRARELLSEMNRF